MTVNKKTTAGKKPAVKKEVINHDPFAMLDDTPVGPPDLAVNETTAQDDKNPGNQQAEMTEENNMQVRQVQESIEVETERVDVDLGEELTIVDAQVKKLQLLNIISDALPARLNAMDVDRVDGAGLQLLTAFFKEAGKKNIDVAWGEISPVLRDAINLLGLAESLKLPEDDGEGTAWGLF